MEKQRELTVWLLALSAVNLTLMVPGGPVETRDFSAISPGVLGAFNLFLTLLGLGSLVLAYLLGTGRSRGYVLAGLAGLGYFAVYALDLASIFPRSPSPMPPLVSVLEWLGLLLAVPLVAVAFHLAMNRPGAAAGASGTSGFSRPVLVGLVLLVLAIVLFATYSAMGA